MIDEVSALLEDLLKELRVIANKIKYESCKINFDY
jgi:hypothetical protein